MTNLYSWLAAASAWWWPRFADHLWQTTVFALVIVMASLVLRRGPARMRHRLFLLASAKFIVPAALFVVLAQQTGLDSLPFFRAAQPGAAETARNALLLYGISEPVATYEVTVVATDSISHNQTYLALTVIWLAGSAAILLLWGIRRRRFLRSLRLGQTIQHGREWQALMRARGSLQFEGEVGLVISPLKIEPAVWRVRKPIVVLPDSIASHLDDDELEAIMLHELVHIQHRDNLIGNLQLALSALLWFHPLVWFLSRKLFDEREQACDERVMEVCRAPEAYASSILKVVRFCFGWRVAGVIGAASGSNLRRRIENIMSNGNTKRRVDGKSRVLASVLVGVAFLILVGAGVYSRPRAVSAVTKEAEQVSTGSGIESVTTAPAADTDKRSSKKTKQQPPPPPPPDAPVIGEPPAPPSVASTDSVSTPAVPPSPPSPPSAASQPVQPTPPVPPAKPAKTDKLDKNKAAKQKTKDKVSKGELIEAPPPVYPEDAKKQKIEGTVSVTITIGDDGNVIFAKARSGPEPLYGAAEAAALKARFKPTTVNGKPAKVAAVMTYNFVASKK